LEYKITKDLSQKFQADLQNCDEEPIHKLGKIQSKGLLFGFNFKLDLLYFSANLEPTLKPLLQGSAKVSLTSLFGEPLKERFIEFIEGRTLSQIYPKLIDWKGIPHKLRFCKSGLEEVIIELETFIDEEEKGLQDDLSALDNFLKLLSDFKNEKDMASNAVSLFKNLSGFDRVMYYKFDEKGDGEVLAEEKAFGLESFLGLRYPASDIPRQARELYVKNIIRSIPDVDDEGISVLGINYTEPVDLSYAVFRSTSPIHNQYLKNMGVIASFGTSIVINGKLWGMIICHHYEGPKKLSFNKRLLSLFFTNGISLWLQTYFVKEQDRLWQLQKNLFHTLRVNLKVDSLFDLVLSNWKVLSKELKLQGFAVYDKKGLRNYGSVLDKADCLKTALQLVKASKEEGEITSLFYSRKEEITNDLNAH
jgi:light-regulated signal transduction histidine kinase (bacteriophytochrome)